MLTGHASAATATGLQVKSYRPYMQWDDETAHFWTNKEAPSFYASARDPLLSLGTYTFNFELFRGTTLLSSVEASSKPALNQDAVFVWKPSVALVESQEYSWHVRVKTFNGTYGAFTPTQRIYFDATPPSKPVISSTTYPQNQVGPAATNATFTFGSSDTDAKYLVYRTDVGTSQQRSFVANGTSRISQDSFVPDDGWTAVDAYVVDRAGNASDEAQYEFGVGGGPAPKDGPIQDSGSPLASEGPAAPGPIAGTNSAITVSGRVTTAAGTPVSGLPVDVYPAMGQTGEATPIASAVSGSDGVWTAQLASLSAELTSLVAANDGVLNFDTIARAETVDPVDGSKRPMEAVSAGSTGVAISGTLSVSAQAARADALPSAPLVAIRKESELGPTPTVAETNDSFAEQEYRKPTTLSTEPQPVDTYRFSSATSGSYAQANPNQIGTVDYSTAQPAPPSSAPAAKLSGKTSASLLAADQCYIVGALVTDVYRETHVYTTVMEGHAYWDAYSTVDYNTTASTDISVGLSYDHGGTWGASGETHIGNEFDKSTGWDTKGPKYSYQLKVPFLYRQLRVSRCDLINGVKTKVYRYDVVRPISVHIPLGGYVSVRGASVLYKDGYDAWAKAPYYYKAQPGWNFSASAGKTIGFSWAASIYGFGARSQTTKSTKRLQRIDMGSNSCCSHDIFSKWDINSYVPVFYSW